MNLTIEAIEEAARKLREITKNCPTKIVCNPKLEFEIMMTLDRWNDFAPPKQSPLLGLASLPIEFDEAEPNYSVHFVDGRIERH